MKVLGQSRVAFLCALAAAFVCVQVAGADMILSVDRMGGQSGNRSPVGTFTGETDPLATQDGGLKAGNIMYSDRDYTITTVPASLIGAEYVRTFNTDKAAAETDVIYRVTFNSATPIFIFVTIDNRLTDQQTRVDSIVSAFAAAGTFTDTGLDVILGEVDGPTQNVFGATLPAGTYDFGASPANASNYYILGAIPEPTTLGLLGFGALGLLRRRR